MKKLVCIFCVLLFIFITSIKSFAQFSFNRFLYDSIAGADKVGWGEGLQIVDGNIIVQTWSWDTYDYNNPRSICLFTINVNGNAIRLNELVDSMIQYDPFASYNSFYKGLSNNLICFGRSKFNTFNTYKGFITKYNSNGNTLFVKHYRPIGIPDSLMCAFIGGIELVDSSLIAGGIYNTSPNKTLLWIIKLDKQGNKYWEKNFAFSNIANIYQNSCWFQNKILISGGWFNHWGPSPFGKEYYTPFILELDTAGNTIFHKDFTDPMISGKLEMYKFNEEKLLVAGLSDSITDNSDFGVFIGMLDKNLNFIWRKHYADTIGYNPFVLKPLHDGNFLVVGGRYDLGHNYYCGMIDKYDSNGVMLWHRLYYKRENTENYLADFAEASNGDIICTGSVTGYVDSASVVHPQNVWILRTDSMGFISSTDSGFSDALGVIDISEDAIQDLKLFPNPARTQLGLLYNIKEISQIYIYSINGLQVFKGKLDATKHEDQIDVSLLIPGMYIIEIINPKGKVSKRILKE